MVIFQRKNLLQLRAFSGFQLILYIKFAYDYIADEDSDKAAFLSKGDPDC